MLSISWGNSIVVANEVECGTIKLQFNMESSNSSLHPLIAEWLVSPPAVDGVVTG